MKNSPFESPQSAQPDSQPSKDRHHDDLIKGFNLMTVAAVFVAAIQAQLMASTVTLGAFEEPSIAIRAINSLYLSGLLLDITSASLAFLTARWLDRLSAKEKAHLEEEFNNQRTFRRGGEKKRRPWKFAEKMFYSWLGYSLFSPMPFLVVGVFCMVGGLYIFVWSQQHVIVASVFTFAGAVVSPMVLGDFCIGQEETRRLRLIERLSEMQGDW